MDEHKWLETRFNAVDSRIKVLTDMMKNHLQHHFVFTMGALAAIVALAATIIKIVFG